MIIKCPGPYIDTGTNMPKKNKFQILSSLLPHGFGGTCWIVFNEALYHHDNINGPWVRDSDPIMGPIWSYNKKCIKS